MTPPVPPQAPPQPPPQPPPQDDGLGDAALAVAVAAVLVTATSAAFAVTALKARFVLTSAAWTALSAVLTDVMQTPPPVTGVIGAASAQTSRMNAARRAQYVIAASKRVLAAARDARTHGKPVGAAIRGQLATERRYYAQHQAAMWNRATAAGKTDMAAAEHGGPLLGWNTVRDDRTSAECKAADRKNFHADRMPDIGWPGGVHPHCFPAGTKVVAPSVLLSTTRWYVGEFVEIVTAAGYDLTVTPNHPVLTPQGYRAAGELHDGSYVVRALDPSAACTAGDPYEHDVVAFIEDVLGASAGPGRVATGTMPVSAVDFHGDGLDHQVAVVRADRELMHRVQVGQPLGVEHLRRIPGGLAVPRAGEFDQVLDAVALSAPGGVGGLGVARVLLGSAPGCENPVSVGVSAQRYTVLAEEPGQRHPVHAEVVGDRLDSIASLVAFDQVRQIRRFRDATHVYNLQTVTGWYTANSIVVHNCRCYPGPPWPGAPLLPSRIASYVRAAA